MKEQRLPGNKILSEILGKKVHYCTLIQENTFGISYENGWQDKINMYELQHLAKEWALKKHNFIMSSHTDASSGVCFVRYDDVDGEEFSTVEGSELDAVIVGCEKLLEEEKLDEAGRERD